MSKRIGLGDVARDRITGFEGVVIARAEWLTNCVRLTLQPKGLKEDGSTKTCESFDEPSLELVAAANPPPEERKAGGPMPAASRRKDPSR